MSKENQNTTERSMLERIANRISPLDRKKTSDRMLLAARIDDLLIEKKLNNRGFAELMHKDASVISKWLSGTHNFTVDTLTEISEALGVSLSALFKEKPEQVVFKAQFAVAQGVSKARMYYGGGEATPIDIVPHRIEWPDVVVGGAKAMLATAVIGLGATAYDSPVKRTKQQRVPYHIVKA